MSPRASRWARWIPLGLVLLVALVFGRALRGGFVYDDSTLIETNPQLRSPGPLHSYLASGIFAGATGEGAAVTGARYWRPFLKLALLLEYRAFGLLAWPWHLVSLLVHAASVWLLWRWLRRRLGGADLLAAVLGTSLFALHPARVEAVAWISGGADLWMTFWVLAGLEAWDRATRAGTALAIAAFVLAVCSKETAVVVPLCLAADAWLLGLRRRSTSRLDRAPWRIGAVAAALAGAMAMQFAVLGGAVRALGSPGWMRPLASLGHLVVRLLWPARPSTQVGLVDPGGQFAFAPWSIALGALSLLALVGLAVAARRLARLRPAVADVAWCVFPLLPVVNLVPLGYTTLVAERFLSLPLVGVAAFATRGLAAALRRWPLVGRVLTLAAGLAIGAGAFVAFAYVPAFRSNATLWAHELRVQPGHPLLHLYAARAAAQEGRLGDAERAARQSYEAATSADGRTDAAVAWAEFRLQASPHGEPAADAELRALFDALAAGRPVRLQAGGFTWELAPSGAHGLDVTRALAFRRARAVTHVRTGSYASAAALFSDLLRDDTAPGNFASLVRSQAAAGEWQAAQAALGEGLRLHPHDAQLASLGGPLGRAASLSTSNPADPEERAALWGQVWLQLGLPLRAQEEFAALGHEPQQPLAILVGALAEAALGDPAGARARVLELRRRAPEHARDCDAVLGEIDRLRASTPRRVNPGRMFE